MDTDREAKKLAASMILAQREAAARTAPVNLSSDAVLIMQNATRQWADETIRVIDKAISSASGDLTRAVEGRNSKPVKIDLGDTRSAIERLCRSLVDLNIDIDISPLVEQMEALVAVLTINNAPSDKCCSPMRFDINRGDNGLITSVIATELADDNPQPETDNIEVE